MNFFMNLSPFDIYNLITYDGKPKLVQYSLSKGVPSVQLKGERVIWTDQLTTEYEPTDFVAQLLVV